jgi:fluoroacetyl-CoA thioesterase
MRATVPEPSQSIPLGIAKSLQIRVDERFAVPALAAAFTGFHDMPPVFATAFMVGFIEWACIEALADHLGPGQKTVGTHIDVSHIKATPVGMTVTAQVELIAVTGRSLQFRVSCSDEAGLIGDGFHQRTVIEQTKFMARLATKAARHV